MPQLIAEYMPPAIREVKIEVIVKRAFEPQPVADITTYAINELARRLEIGVFIYRDMLVQIMREARLKRGDDRFLKISFLACEEANEGMMRDAGYTWCEASEAWQ